MHTRTWAVVALAVGIWTGCGTEPNDEVIGESSPAAVTDDVVLAANEHLVQRGDTLWGIAETTCGDPWAYVDIFNQNVGLIQDDGDALVEPSLIEIGWILVIECSGPEDSEFQQAPPDETVGTPPNTIAVPSSSAGADSAPGSAPSSADGSVPSSAPGSTTADEGADPHSPIQFVEVPTNAIEVGSDADDAGDRPVSDVVTTDCVGTSSLPLIESPKAVLRAGETAEAHAVQYGQTFGVTVEDMSEPISVQLVDAEGATLAFEPRPGGFFDLFIDAGLASGDYTVEADSPTSAPAYVRLEIRGPDEPDLVRQSNDDPIEFLLIGAADVGADLYREQTDGCAVSWEYWQDLGELAVNADGNGRVAVPVAGFHPGVYCLTFDTSNEITSQCRHGRKVFVLG
jgi:hypothetical protein